MALSRHPEATFPDLAVVGYDFLRTEIQTGLTLAALAADSRRGPAKMKRNQADARKAYDTVLRFINQVPLAPEKYNLIREKFKKLKCALQELGEKL